ncbi:TPA: 23S rRNA (adenine(2503)-C(2))-methyltransferase RlmN [Candidatus Gastranaerophilales bacterium HUM_6]|nr:ribosomal RNA large subunit methyltransferase N [Fusobacterium sp. CAG:815]DAA89413.1 MAG TPA: 23S rRNA (adenine(2503)-C(2))-methyltransferase RlmN [Candidatus Gastranaerophilales bacterium HUM_6]DAA93926.1 MAG TPA: 23S rRNA (adenine(2503)-C(2))-methyltransferase RlmN [Candidatus Gastranaerophilales bacterium HUM_7]DAB03484.1 MAG TPA: 23S rRNA (adenine(2503)-C(2))-methyltransferase RlmN [Candidatus Gastranaerophilales bacterium HUM_12]DAB07670.1 MAG TPA: 23S rRNA (adenine(2503)-C(2))-methylt
MKNLSGLTLKEIEQITDELGATKFRARQIHNWIYLKSVKEIDEMTDLSKKFRDELKTVAQVTNIKIKVKQVSTDGTIKYLLEFPDGECVETVLMRFDNRANLTACVSSQVGCAVNCSFCATGKRGFIRNLTYKEIIEQVLTIQRDTGLKVTNVVFMGQGEPLLNLDNVLKAMEMFNESFQIGARRLTVSTSGIIPQIKKLADLDMQSTLALSLHASNHEVRKQLMQIENKYPMNELHKALKYYVEKTGRRITIEYLLIKDLNDTITSAKQLAAYLKDIKCNINLIPYNPTAKNDYKRPSNNSIMKFKYLMEHSGKKVTVRLERGGDIDAACGQLSGKVNADKV